MGLLTCSCRNLSGLCLDTISDGTVNGTLLDLFVLGDHSKVQISS
ncbi:hypothetical protein [Actinacidiphila soli]|nr:hypothetical protein [Actinacidiphila soli]